MMTALGALGGAGLVIFAVALFDFRARRLTSAEEIVEGLGIAHVGTIPKTSRRARRVKITSAEERDVRRQSQLTEAVDAVRTLLLRVSGESSRLVMVTSAVRGEGKPRWRASLPRALHALGVRPLLIDGDLRNPVAHSLFSVPKEPGLSELAAGRKRRARGDCYNFLGTVVLHAGGAVGCRRSSRAGAATSARYWISSRMILNLSSSIPPRAYRHGHVASRSARRHRLTDGPAQQDPNTRLYSAYQRLSAVGVPVLGTVLIGGGSTLDTDMHYPTHGGTVAQNGAYVS